MSKLEAPVPKTDSSELHVAHPGSEKPLTPPVTPSDNHNLISGRSRDVGPEFGQAPVFYDSSKDSKIQLHPKGALSPEGPPAKLFEGLGPNQQRVENGVIYARDTDADGTDRRVIRDPVANTRLDDVSHPDGSTESIKYQTNFREAKTFDADGKVRSYSLNDDTVHPQIGKNDADAKFNQTVTREYDHGDKIEDNNRWKTKDGQWHEDNWMKMSDDSTYHVVMNGDVTTKTRVNPDGSWTNSVQTMNVDKIDPVTGRHYKTMTVDRTESPKKKAADAPE